MGRTLRFPKILWPQVELPEGKIFKGANAKKIIDEWKDEQQIVLKKQGSFIKAAAATESRLKDLVKETSGTAREVKKAHGQYKQCKSPVAKARWGRRLILATELHTYVRESHQMLNSTVTRIKDAIEDGRLVIQLIDNQIKDAQMYYQIDGQVQLIGKALAAAKERHVMPEVQYQSLEISIEEVESTLSEKSDEEIIRQADRLLEAPKGEDDPTL